MQEFYTLPEISFVGGETQDLRFYMKTPKKQSFNMDGCNADFTLISYSNKNGTPIISKLAETVIDVDGVRSIVKVVLLPADTSTLHGKFIYQLTITDSKGTVEIPNQGIIFIHKNINQ